MELITRGTGMRAQERRGAARVITVEVRHDQPVEARDAAMAQVRQHDPFASVRVARVARPGVVEPGAIASSRAGSPTPGRRRARSPIVRRWRVARRGHTKSGSATTAPSQRAGHPGGASSHAIPIERQHDRGPRRRRHRPRRAGQAQQSTRATPPAPRTPRAATPSSAFAIAPNAPGSAASAPATSASGVTIQLTSGIATALASGETSDNW